MLDLKIEKNKITNYIKRSDLHKSKMFGYDLSFQKSMPILKKQNRKVSICSYLYV